VIGELSEYQDRPGAHLRNLPQSRCQAGTHSVLRAQSALLSAPCNQYGAGCVCAHSLRYAAEGHAFEAGPSVRPNDDECGAGLFGMLDQGTAGLLANDERVALPTMSRQQRL